VNAFTVLDMTSNADLRERDAKRIAFKDDIIAIIYESLFDSYDENENESQS